MSPSSPAPRDSTKASTTWGKGALRSMGSSACFSSASRSAPVPGYPAAIEAPAPTQSKGRELSSFWRLAGVAGSGLFSPLGLAVIPEGGDGQPEEVEELSGTYLLYRVPECPFPLCLSGTPDGIAVSALRFSVLAQRRGGFPQGRGGPALQWAMAALCFSGVALCWARTPQARARMPKRGRMRRNGGRDLPFGRRELPSNGPAGPSVGQELPSEGRDGPFLGQSSPREGTISPSVGRAAPPEGRSGKLEGKASEREGRAPEALRRNRQSALQGSHRLLGVDASSRFLERSGHGLDGPAEIVGPRRRVAHVSDAEGGRLHRGMETARDRDSPGGDPRQQAGVDTVG